MVKEAKRNLLEIYQLEKDWEKAIAIAAELPDIASQKEIAEYYCELAAAEMIRSRPDLASGYLKTALERNRKCVRASLLQGDIESQQDRSKEAIACWQRIEQQCGCSRRQIKQHCQHSSARSGGTRDGTA